MKRLPEDFANHDGDPVMSNSDHIVDQKVAEAIKGKPLYSDYPGWNFFGRVWWDGEWNCEVWQYHSHSDTISAETLEDLMHEVSENYGYE